MRFTPFIMACSPELRGSASTAREGLRVSSLQAASCDDVQACIPDLCGPVPGGGCGVRRAVPAQQTAVPPQVLQCVLQRPSKPTAAHHMRLAKELQTCKLLRGNTI